VPNTEIEEAKLARENNLPVHFSNTPHLYILNDSLVLYQKDCKVIQALAASQKKKN